MDMQEKATDLESGLIPFHGRVKNKNRESNARTYARMFQYPIIEGEGSLVKDAAGFEYIDCLAGAGTLATGHNHPAIKTKLIEHLNSSQLLHGLDISTPIKSQYIEAIFNSLPSEFANKAKVHFCGPAGTDATEAAVKLFKTATNRRTVIAFHGGYHGMTAGALALTGNLSAKEKVPGLMPDVHFLPFPYTHRCPYGSDGSKTVELSLAHMRNVLSDPESGITKPAAIIVEAVQGEGGCIPAPIEWLQGLRALTSEFDIPLIIDEIQTGFGRTGKMFAFEHAGIIPDAILLSKAAGGGLPISLLLYNEKYDIWGPGAHTGTFRGNQLAMVAGIEQLRILNEDNLVEDSHRKGIKLLSQLKKLATKHEIIGDVRGKGLLVGVEINTEHSKNSTEKFHQENGALAKQIKALCFAKGLIVETGGRYGAVIRFLPALTIPEELLNKAVDILDEAIAEATQPKMSLMEPA